MTSPDKKTKNIKNENDENLPFDIYDSKRFSSENNDSFLSSKSASTSNVITSNSNADGGRIINEYDEDDEEDFISKYIFIRTKPNFQMNIILYAATV